MSRLQKESSQSSLTQVDDIFAHWNSSPPLLTYQDKKITRRQTPSMFGPDDPWHLALPLRTNTRNGPQTRSPSTIMARKRKSKSSLKAKKKTEIVKEMIEITATPETGSKTVEPVQLGQVGPGLQSLRWWPHWYKEKVSRGSLITITNNKIDAKAAKGIK